jgi:hypothetical protein
MRGGRGIAPGSGGAWCAPLSPCAQSRESAAPQAPYLPLAPLPAGRPYRAVSEALPRLLALIT